MVLNFFQLEKEEEVTLKVKEGELVKVFQASASLCVSRGLMAAEAALGYYRSGET